MKHSGPKKLIVLGSSTGGPSHIAKILGSLKPLTSASMIIAQHMGKFFIPSFVSRLNDSSALSVRLASDKMAVETEAVYVCSDLIDIVSRDSVLTFKVTTNTPDAYNPNIDYLFSSTARLQPEIEILAILLTGIGEDGVKGTILINESGGRCIAESEKSAIVYGMPARAKELVKDIEVKTLDEIINAIQTFGE